MLSIPSQARTASGPDFFCQHLWPRFQPNHAAKWAALPDDFLLRSFSLPPLFLRSYNGRRNGAVRCYE